jgi:hypothetical protein
MVKKTTNYYGVLGAVPGIEIMMHSIHDLITQHAEMPSP